MKAGPKLVLRKSLVSKRMPGKFRQFRLQYVYSLVIFEKYSSLVVSNEILTSDSSFVNKGMYFWLATYRYIII